MSVKSKKNISGYPSKRNYECSKKTTMGIKLYAKREDEHKEEQGFTFIPRDIEIHPHPNASFNIVKTMLTVSGSIPFSANGPTEFDLKEMFGHGFPDTFHLEKVILLDSVVHNAKGDSMNSGCGTGVHMQFSRDKTRHTVGQFGTAKNGNALYIHSRNFKGEQKVFKYCKQKDHKEYIDSHLVRGIESEVKVTSEPWVCIDSRNPIFPIIHKYYEKRSGESYMFNRDVVMQAKKVLSYKKKPNAYDIRDKKVSLKLSGVPTQLEYSLFFSLRLEGYSVHMSMEEEDIEGEVDVESAEGEIPYEEHF